MRPLTEDELSVLRLVQEIWGDLNTPDELIDTEHGGVGLFVKAQDGSSPLFVDLSNLGAWYSDGSLSHEKLREWILGPSRPDAVARMDLQSPTVDVAITQLHLRSVFRSTRGEHRIRSLIPVASWRPIREEWWTKKEACVIGEDTAGNLLLRVCDGTVRLWDRATSTDEILATSVHSFLIGLTAPPTPRTEM